MDALITAIAELLDVARDSLRAHMLPVLRDLVVDGFLDLPSDGGFS